MKLPVDFYRRSNTVTIARELLGKVLFTSFNGKQTGGIITETEAYVGTTDKACHAYGGRYTQRTQTLYKSGGISYVYLCYGIHHLFNVVTHEENEPHAILIRGIFPTEGVSEILKRRNARRLTPEITTGPGKVTRALGITTRHNNYALTGNKIWIEDAGIKIKSSEIKKTPRIGVDYAGKDALLPYRFVLDRKDF